MRIAIGETSRFRDRPSTQNICLLISSRVFGIERPTDTQVEMVRDQWTVGDSARVFRERFRGDLLQRGDEGYDEARAIWNGMIDRKPGLIARPTGVADVVTAVNFARDNDVLVAVKGGGHSIAGNAVCDGGLMIDLSEMNDVRVDPTGQDGSGGPGSYTG